MPTYDVTDAMLIDADDVNQMIEVISEGRFKRKDDGEWFFKPNETIDACDYVFIKAEDHLVFISYANALGNGVCHAKRNSVQTRNYPIRVGDFICDIHHAISCCFNSMITLSQAGILDGVCGKLEKEWFQK
jgi:hypothetical protein